jgi:hypothetical protein
MEVRMDNIRIWFTASLGVGILQAWDSGAFTSGAVPALLTIAGIAAPTAAIVTHIPHVVRIVALIVGAALLVAARIAAPVPLSALHLALFPAALYILVLKGLMPRATQRPA